MSDPTAPNLQPTKVNKGCLGCLGVIILIAAFGWLLDEGGCTTPEGFPKVGTEYTCTQVVDGMKLSVILNDSHTDVFAPTYNLGYSVRVKIVAYTEDEKYALVEVLEGQYTGKQGYIATAIMKQR